MTKKRIKLILIHTISTNSKKILKTIIYTFICIVFLGCSSTKDIDKYSAEDSKVLNDIKTGRWNGTVHKLESPLQSAVFHDNIEFVKRLLKNGHDMNFVDSEGGSLLNVAARYSSLEMNLFLINLGIDINNIGSPLRIICRYRSKILLKLYLDHGADFENLESSLLESIYDRSHDGGYEMIELLVDSGLNLKDISLHTVLAFDIDSYLELLIKKGANYSVIDENGWTYLHWTAYYNAYRCAKVLKKYNDLNRRTKKAFERKIYIKNKDTIVNYKAGILPIEIAEINKNMEVLEVLKQ